MNNRYNGITETIGKTPVVKINRLAPDGVNVYVKIEAFNPMASVKDRMALAVIEDAESTGQLQPGQTVVEATSGNTGIALAMVCAEKGYPLVITMAENFSVERRRLIRFLGAKVVLTPAAQKGSGMVAKAAELAEAHNWYYPKQFENPANADAHSRTTAVEILEDFDDIALDYWVSGFGTGGTLRGVSRTLKERSPNTKIMVCEPDNAQILSSGIKQQRHADGSHSESHPNFRPHLMQGWSPDFVPKLAEQAQGDDTIDGFIPIDGNNALDCARQLAQKEGIFCGISGGATLSGALKLANSVPKGSNILCMLPDTGERYMTTTLFDSVEDDMNEGELAISTSTAGFRFDIANAPAVAAAEEAPELDPLAVQEVEDLVSNNNGQIVMFALEWCEFCWSVRNMLKEYGIEYKSVDLDAVAYQEGQRGGKLRAALSDKTGCNTFPQIFINGEFIGGCTDLFDAAKDGSLASKLDHLDIAYHSQVNTDPYSFFPTWLHSR
jgi:cysteine synthase A